MFDFGEHSDGLVDERHAHQMSTDSSAILVHKNLGSPMPSCFRRHSGTK
jgi:hypothetical protein